MDYLIRKLNQTDMDAIVRLFNDAFQHDHIYEDHQFDIQNNGALFRTAIEHAVIHGHSLGAFLDSTLVSFLLGFDYHTGMAQYPHAMADIFCLDETGRSAYHELTPFFQEARKHPNLYYIMSLATQQEFRNQGLAGKLIDVLITHTNKDIISDTSSAISTTLCRHRGFQITQLGEDYHLAVLSR